jgi:hypothetical protein
MSTIIGTITLRSRKEFTQYGEHAAWTDYVTCDPQTVELKTDGYWVYAAFNGILTRSSYPSGARHIGREQQASIQTQGYGGIGRWLEHYDIALTAPHSLKQVGTYDDGSPMVALARNDEALVS